MTSPLRGRLLLLAAASALAACAAPAAEDDGPEASSAVTAGASPLDAKRALLATATRRYAAAVDAREVEGIPASDMGGSPAAQRRFSLGDASDDYVFEVVYASDDVGCVGWSADKRTCTYRGWDSVVLRPRNGKGDYFFYWYRKDGRAPAGTELGRCTGTSPELLHDCTVVLPPR